MVSAQGHKTRPKRILFKGVTHFLEDLKRRRPVVSAEGQKLVKNAPISGGCIFLGFFEPPEAAGQRRRPETCLFGPAGPLAHGPILAHMGPIGPMG